MFFWRSFAGFCLLIALVLAWVLGVTLFFPDGALAGHIVVRADLVRAHVDFLMMAQFLFIFFLVFRQLSINPPLWVVGACCYGAFFNPLAFLKRALTPKAIAAVPADAYFPLPAALSFGLITLGFLAAVVLAVQAAWKQRT